MLILLSPAKTLNMQAKLTALTTTMPRLLEETDTLVTRLQVMPVSELKQLMHLSDALARLNHQRYQSFSAHDDVQHTTHALAAFRGDVYEGLDADSLPAKALQRAQDHLRILSGLYGLLRPGDLMQAYRLEMGTSLAIKDSSNLYQFWGDKITALIEADAKATKANAVVNLASVEYAKAVSFARLHLPVIHPVFKEEKQGVQKIISFFAKKARGSMARWLLEEHITAPKDISQFNRDGYRFQPQQSNPEMPVFVRVSG